MTTAIGAICKSYDATTTIRPRRIVTFGNADSLVVEATTAGAGGIGVADSLGDVPGGRCDVCRTGLVDVVYGGNVTRGQRLTNDNQGRAVVATAGQSVVGVAEYSGAANDIGKVLLTPGVILAP